MQSTTELPSRSHTHRRKINVTNIVVNVIGYVLAETIKQLIS